VREYVKYLFTSFKRWLLFPGERAALRPILAERRLAWIPTEGKIGERRNAPHRRLVLAYFSGFAEVGLLTLAKNDRRLCHNDILSIG
jgi:hypothetical protein